MGNIYHGIPKHIALRLRDEYNLHNFIETGTHLGATMIWAADYFDRVVTIELQRERWQKVISRLDRNDTKNVVVLLGDSRDVLGRALSMCIYPALIWLDAHWSGDLGYDCPNRGECPVVRELGIINADSEGHVVMIDDAHQFANPPNDDWPNLFTLAGKLSPMHWIEDDVIVSVPWREGEG